MSNMLDLNQMSVFIRVVREGSFTGAARSLSIPKSRVSRMITDLEEKLQLRLLERTTRDVRPTDVGLQYYEQFKPLFEEITDIHARISDDQSAPSGVLRISAPVGFAVGTMGKLTAEFKERYPDIQLEIVFGHADTNLIRDGYDCGFAIGNLEDSSLIARKFDDTTPVLVASPDFIKRYGPFEHPDQLSNVPWVSIGSREDHIHASDLIHKTTGEKISPTYENNVMVNHHDVGIQHIIAGHGVAVAASFFAYEAMLNGELEVLLPEWEVEHEPLYLVFPSGRHLPKKTRAFVDFFMEKSEEMHALMDGVEHLSQEEQMAALKKFLNEKNLN